jgi:cation diffusion facilitator CzcD-associated flavoprotein CzcO
VHLDGNERIDARVLVVATGIVSQPREPAIPGRAEFERGGGRVLHSVHYREPSALLGKRVLVVGVGNSGGEIASEIAHTSTPVTIAVRSGANVVPRDIAGIPVQYLATFMRRLPRRVREAIVAAMRRVVEARRGPPVLPRPTHGPLDAIPLIGFNLVDAIRAGLVIVRGGIERLTAHGARFADGRSPDELPVDVVILATGFAPALQPLGQLVRVDQKGFALRRDRVASADLENLYFVGHNYDSTGGLFNIKRDAVEVAKRVARGASDPGHAVP